MELPARLIQQGIDRGTILHSTLFKEIDHGKFFVVIGVSHDSVAGFFFINSAIHHSIFSKPEQLAMQYPVKHADYAFLKYDSFICATNVRRISIDRLSKTIEDGETHIIGQMFPSHMEELLETARKSPLFSKIEKITFFY